MMRRTRTMRAVALGLLASVALGGATEAAVPVNDGAILNKRTDEAGKKVEIKTITDQVKNYTQGIGCAATTPGQAKDVKSPTTTPDAGRGAATLDKADPTIASSPAFKPPTGGGTGTAGQGGQGDWTAAPRAERAQTGQVIGGMETIQQQIQPNKQVFESMSKSIGQDGTIMESMDRNSALRSQTGLTFNQAIQGVSYLTQAWNLANLATSGLTSQASRGVTFTLPAGTGRPPVQTIYVCPAGTSGQGTAGSPCISTACAPNSQGLVTEPGCVARRTTDTIGNVGFLITQVQSTASSQPSTLSTDELMAAVSQYQTR